MPSSPDARRPAPAGRASGDAGAAILEYLLIVLLLVAVGFGASTLLNRYDGGRPLLSDTPDPAPDPGLAPFPERAPADEPTTTGTTAPATTTTTEPTTTTTIARRAPTTARPSRTTARHRA
jgi:hypothetical protein